MCSYSDLSPWIKTGRRCSCLDSYFHFAYEFKPHILAHVYGLLGPCFKTGRMTPCRSTQRGAPTSLNSLAIPDLTSKTKKTSRAYKKRKRSPANSSPHPVHFAVFPPKRKRQRADDRARTRVDKRREARGTSLDDTTPATRHRSAKSQTPLTRTYPTSRPSAGSIRLHHSGFRHV